MHNMVSSRIFPPCRDWEDTTFPFWSHSGNAPWEPHKTRSQNNKTPLLVQRGLNDGGSYGSLILRTDSQGPKSWWKLLYVCQPSTAEGRGACSSAAQERSWAGASKAGWMPAESPSARGILSWENLAAFQTCSSAYTHIYICIYV